MFLFRLSFQMMFGFILGQRFIANQFNNNSELYGLMTMIQLFYFLLNCTSTNWNYVMKKKIDKQQKMLVIVTVADI